MCLCCLLKLIFSGSIAIGSKSMDPSRLQTCGLLLHAWSLPKGGIRGSVVMMGPATLETAAATTRTTLPNQGHEQKNMPLQHVGAFLGPCGPVWDSCQGGEGLGTVAGLLVLPEATWGTVSNILDHPPLSDLICKHLGFSSSSLALLSTVRCSRPFQDY